ncbi:uncharacterized protein LOC126266733 [Schistocerca gregaria]|uniref:uncharacterized protein LOC126266733 n=1 Tax=Schistocerca gregaria TaxID=7010 RepID=UPI00211EB624|nr:uncharacterized protein LOC126266733 [Schistocerca gregaria]
MKTTFAVVVAAVCLTVSPGDATSLEGAFVNSTRIIPAPSISYYSVNGTAMKEMMIEAVSSYLANMTDGIGFQTANAARWTYRSIRNMQEGIEYTVINIQSGVNDSFDNILPVLATAYRNFSSAVKGGLRSTKHFNSQGNLRTGAGQQRDSGIWTLDEAFVHLPETVAPDLQKLHDWILDFAYIGISNATAELPAIMEERRVTSLYPRAAAAMLLANSYHQSYDQLFQEYSSPDIYSDYAAARDELLSLEIE